MKVPRGRKHVTDCLFCRSPAGSREHSILAGLGGRRVDRGILCDPCNQGFGQLDAALVEDMRPLNALLGVHNGRTRKPISAVAEDLDTGRTYVLSEGGKLQHPDAVVLSDRTDAGVRNIFAVASTQAQHDEFIHRLRVQDGKPVVVAPRRLVPHLFAGAPTLSWQFGGADTLRAVGRLALNVLAHHKPRIAREAWMDGFKELVRAPPGTAPDPWVRFEYIEPDPRLPQEHFAFQHRIILGFVSSSGLVYGRVSLFGVVELSVLFGNTDILQDETIVHDVDVIATSGADEVRLWRSETDALAQPVSQCVDPSLEIPKRLQSLMKKHSARMWERDALVLLPAINAAYGAAAHEVHGLVVDALRGQEQRLLKLAREVADRARIQFVSALGEEAGNELGDAFATFAQPDGAAEGNVTGVTRAVADLLRYVVADHLTEVLRTRRVESDEARDLLEGRAGLLAVGQSLWDMLKARHPLFRA